LDSECHLLILVRERSQIETIKSKSASITMSNSKETILQGWTLKGRNYMVTGGAKGIGLATVKALLAHDAQTVIFCSRSSGVNEMVHLQNEFPKSSVIHVSCDISNQEARQSLFNACKSHVPTLHGLINNVGQYIES